LRLIEGYHSQSQKIRILTESWVGINSYCPNCGHKNLTKFENNNPFADFYCGICNSEFELKSTLNTFRKKINDGAYRTMITKIRKAQNPNFLFLNYTARNSVNNFFAIPKHYFIPEIIEKRKPLSSLARRAGWVGCNILISSLPISSRIYLIKDEQIVNRNHVIKQWVKTSFLENIGIKNKSWLIEIISIVDQISSREFTLNEVYKFEDYLRGKFPNNNFVKEKIRQQLQILRDKNYIKFIDKGLYKKV
jgi:type II restriction enzyme